MNLNRSGREKPASDHLIEPLFQLVDRDNDIYIGSLISVYGTGPAANTLTKLISIKTESDNEVV